MTKLLPFIVGFATTVATFLPVFAASHLVQAQPVPVSPRQELRQERQEPRGEVRTQIQEKREELKGRLDEKRLKNISGYFERMTRRLEAALLREKKLADRIEARIKKFEGKGAKLDEAKKNLEDARTAWKNAQKALMDAKSKFETLKTAGEPKAVFAEVRKLVKDVVDLVKKTHALMVKAIISLKGASGSLKPEKSPATAPKGGRIIPAPGASQ